MLKIPICAISLPLPVLLGGGGEGILVVCRHSWFKGQCRQRQLFHRAKAPVPPQSDEALRQILSSLSLFPTRVMNESVGTVSGVGLGHAELALEGQALEEGRIKNWLSLDLPVSPYLPHPEFQISYQRF